MDEETPKGARLPDAGVRTLYSLENRWQAWLDVEAALARAQAELGIIPQDAADRDRRQRAARADGSRAHRRRLRRAPATRIVPLVWELSRVVRRAARRLGALGRDHAEHHPDRRSAGAAPGARDLPPLSSARRWRRWPTSPSAPPTCRCPAARTASTRCRRRSASRSRSGSTSCCAIVERFRQSRRACSSPCSAAVPAPIASLGKQGPPVQAGIGQISRHRLDARAVARARRPSRREHLHARPARPRPAARSAARSIR